LNAQRYHDEILRPTVRPIFVRYLWPTVAYLYSQSCEIQRLGPNSFISVDWIP
jgi:hypothetical protein